MAGKISIRGLKHIKVLDFDIPGPGVHLLAGSNGSGKTSVLACLRRIGQPNAFAQHFTVSKKSASLDNFEGAEVTYSLPPLRTVTYAYGGQRWVPRPRNQNRLLGKFGYPNVFYVGATAERITPRPEDFKTSRARPVHQDIRTAANSILDTNKFDSLYTINVTTGYGNSAFLIRPAAPPNAKYFSERNFSLGELCVLKLVNALRAIPNNSLVLIDELELALHPKAQIRLFDYLKEIAATKRLTVVFSTHSVSLLKVAKRREIIFLENEDGAVKVIYGCYPTYALGGIAYDEERAPDFVFYVEDDSAAYIVDMLIRKYLRLVFPADRPIPVILTVPVGAFMNVVRFVARGSALLPPGTRATVLLDNDVEVETVANWRATNNFARLQEFQAIGNMIGYLPWTPEVGLVNFLRQPIAQRLLREAFSDNRINIPVQHFNNIPVAAGGAQRSACKEAIKNLATHVSGFLPNHDEDSVRRKLFEIFATWYFDNNQGLVQQMLGPRIN